MGLRHGRLHVGEPPFQPPGGGDEEGGPGELPHANHCPGVARPSLPLVGLAMRPVPYPVVPPAGSASVPQRGHGPDANPQVANLGLPGGLALPDAGPAVSAPPPSGRPRGDAPTAGDIPGPGPGHAANGSPPPHRHTSPGQPPGENRKKEALAAIQPHVRAKMDRGMDGSSIGSASVSRHLYPGKT